MKKAIFVLSSALIFLSSCASGETRIDPRDLDLNKAYSFTASAEYNGFTAAAEFTRRNADIWDITLTEPFALEGFTLSYIDGAITARYGGLEVTSAGSELPDAVYKLIIDAIEHAIFGEGREIAASGDEIRVNGVVADNAPYTLTFDKKSLTPKALALSGNGIKVEFSQGAVSDIVNVVFEGEVIGVVDVNEAESDNGDYGVYDENNDGDIVVY